MKFTLLDYSKADGDSGYFRNVSYPYQPGGILDLNGVGIKVIQATNEKLDYIILKKVPKVLFFAKKCCGKNGFSVYMALIK